MHICRIWRVLRWMLISELYCKLIWFISNLLLLFLGSCVQGQQRWGWYSCFVLVLQSTVFCGEEILSSKKRSSHASLLSLVRQLIIIMRRYYTTLLPRQRAKKIIFTACPLGKLKLAVTSPNVISASPKSFLTSRIDFTVLLLFEFLKKYITCPSGKLKIELTSPITKSTSPGLSDTTFFARCKIAYLVCK